MAFERSTPGTGPAAEPGLPHPVEGGDGAAAGATDQVPAALRMQILSTEHWSLLASRSLAWNESFARAGMYLTLVTGSVVALALVAQASAFGEGFRLFALVILPVVLFAGIGTLLRMGISNYHDAFTVVGMNRIRHAYTEIAPELRRYFVSGTHDDNDALDRTMAVPPGTSMLVQMLASTPMLVSVVNGVVAATIGGLLAIQLGVAVSPTFGIAIAVFVLVMAGQFAYASREIAREFRDYRPLFPQDGPEG